MQKLKKSVNEESTNHNFIYDEVMNGITDSILEGLEIV